MPSCASPTCRFYFNNFYGSFTNPLTYQPTHLTGLVWGGWAGPRLRLSAVRGLLTGAVMDAARSDFLVDDDVAAGVTEPFKTSCKQSRSE